MGERFRAQASDIMKCRLDINEILDIKNMDSEYFHKVIIYTENFKLIQWFSLCASHNFYTILEL